MNRHPAAMIWGILYDHKDANAGCERIDWPEQEELDVVREPSAIEKA